MIKNFIIILFLTIFVFGVNAKAEISEFSSEEFLNDLLLYMDNNYQIDASGRDLTENIKQIIKSSKDMILDEINRIMHTFTSIILICMLSSVLNTCVSSKSVGETALFGCYVVCASLFAYEFEKVTYEGINAIHDVCDFMNISFPGLTSVLASSGYSTAASSVHIIFVTASNIMAFLLNRFIVPIIYSGAILTLSNGISNITEIDNVVKFIIKSLKYTIGILLTVFSAIISFTGFSASLGDGMIIKTAKYAISNFVPIVGSCLADTLNSVVYISVLMKNTIGIVGITVILTICLIPIIKLFIMSFSVKILSYLISMIQQPRLGKMAETLSEIISFIASMLLFITVVFILIIGVIASIGV